MRVLWFSNTPANASGYFNQEIKQTGGWLQSLDREIQNHIDLSIAFFHSTDKPFRYKKTTYIPIKKERSRIYKFFRKFFNYKIKTNYLNDFKKVITTVKPDIIHIHGTELCFGEIYSITTIPIVISIQGNITVYRHKYYSGIEKKYTKNKLQKKDALKTILFGNRFQHGYRFLNSQYKNEKRYFLNCKYIIGRTDWDRRISSVLSETVKYFHNDEILRDSFYKNQWIPINKNRKIIIHTTTSSNMYKGFETICQSLNLLNEKNLNIEWRIAGLRSNDPLIELIKLKLKNDFPKKGIIYLGSLSEKELVQKMLEANLFVMPSHIENSPNSLCEAMMLGMPCISSFCGGVGSLLRDREDGILIQDGDPWAMAGAIIELLNNSTLSYKYSTNARKKALERHSKTKVITDLISIYESIIYVHQGSKT